MLNHENSRMSEESVNPEEEIVEQPDSSSATPAPAGDDMQPRLERLGGEPAPDITPEEFARLQQNGQIHIDPRGRVRSTSPSRSDAGISLRKRRAWYTSPCSRI